MRSRPAARRERSSSLWEDVTQSQEGSPMSSVPAAALQQQPLAGAWRRALVLLGLAFVWLGALYRDTAASMFAIWMRSETFQHCFLIVPIVLWLIWQKRARLAQIAPTPALLPLLPAAVVGFGWLLGELTAVNALTQFAFVALIVLTVPALLGWRVAREIAFPLGFLFLAVPFGEFVMPTMMEYTADFTVLALRLSGIVVYREGLHFNIPSGSWSVVEACSGVRYLIASFTVGLLFAYLNYRSLKRRLIFVAVSIAVPIIANWLRAYIIVMLGHLSGNTIATGVDHLVYGWVFFGVVIMIMFAIGARWSEDTSAELEPVAVGGEKARPIAMARPAMQGLVMLPMLLIVALPVLANSFILRGEAAAPVALELPAQAGNWRKQPQALGDWKPAFDNPSALSINAYQRDGATVGVYVGYYRNQNYTRKLVSSSNVLVTSEDKAWTQVRSGATEVRYAGQAVLARSAELRAARSAAGAAEERLLVWHWYWINGRLTSSDRQAKLLTAWSRLTGAGDDSAVVILYAPKGAADGGLPALAAFAAEAGAAIDAALRQAKEVR